MFCLFPCVSRDDRVVLEMAKPHIGSILIVRGGKLAGTDTARVRAEGLETTCDRRFPADQDGVASARR